MSEAIDIVSQGKHDPMRAHERVKSFYNWEDIAERTENVYEVAVISEQRMQWYVYVKSFPVEMLIGFI
jgi:phosphatidylinositol glycan class A protein